MFEGQLIAIRSGELVQQVDRVAQTARAGSRKEIERLGVSPDALSVADEAQGLHRGSQVDAPEVEALAARGDCCGDFVGIGRREDEHNVRRWLLERLEEGVK